MQDIGGDGFFFATIRSYRYKGWVNAMFVPYTVLFALAAIVSLVSFLVNGRILLLRCRQHGVAFAPGPLGLGKQNTVGGVDVPANSAMSELKAKFDLHRFERRRHICGLLLGLLEDLPLGAPLFALRKHQTIGIGLCWLDTVCAVAGTMNSLFVIRSVIECVDLATGAKSTVSSTCDIQPGQLTFMLLSLLTSALMLGMKLASVEIIRLEQQEMSRMEAERDMMLRELQEELKAVVGSPEEAREVEKVFRAAAAAESAECQARVAAADPATAVASQSSQQKLRSGIDKRGTQSPAVVLEMTTFEIGMIPECGR